MRKVTRQRRLANALDALVGGPRKHNFVVLQAIGSPGHFRYLFGRARGDLIVFAHDPAPGDYRLSADALGRILGDLTRRKPFGHEAFPIAEIEKIADYVDDVFCRYWPNGDFRLDIRKYRMETRSPFLFRAIMFGLRPLRPLVSGLLYFVSENKAQRRRAKVVALAVWLGVVSPIGLVLWVLGQMSFVGAALLVGGPLAYAVALGLLMRFLPTGGGTDVGGWSTGDGGNGGE